MFDSCKKVKLNTQEVMCYDLTYGYILGVGNGTIPETKEATVLDGTDLTHEDLLKLRGSEIEKLHQAILRLTYPNMYDENGDPIELEPQDDTEDDKKKA